MKLRGTLFAFFFLVLPVYAHIGSSGITFEGKAGNYPVMILINPPDVIPGTAVIDVFASDPDIESILVKPIYWFAGDEATPDADRLDPVAGEQGHFQGLTWLMRVGTSSVEIIVTGKKGIGKIVVPIMAVSTAQRSMSPFLSWSLLASCAVLVALLVTIVSTAMSDALVKPHGNIQAAKRRRTIGAVISFCVIMLVLYGGKMWWDSWALKYKRFLYRPLSTSAEVQRSGNTSVLTLRVDSAGIQNNARFTRRMSFLVPDHGKLMHMFMVRAETMDVFAHLHPQRKDSLTFETHLPPMPAGRYWIFADVSWASGFNETLTDTVTIGSSAVTVAYTPEEGTRMSQDDTFFQTNAILTNTVTAGADIILCGKPGLKTTLPDKSSIIWEQDAREPLQSGKLYLLKFSALEPSGAPMKLEPYLGMMGHAVVMKDDGSVYIHLHPVGSYSTSSQQTMITRIEETGRVDMSKFSNPRLFYDSIEHYVQSLDAMTEAERNTILMASMVHDTTDPEHAEHTEVSFPYSFPSPGNYRIWIQMKRDGKILNSAFDAVVN
ncbi:MAG TPA: hypothetical protein VD816_09795 [Ohtaekwangia sp.]|nr:hypothetical protein [Ohtaekwangia sp.]